MTTESVQPAEPPMHPFTRDDADIVLRSSDGEKFRVHRWVLILASPVMETLLSLPQPASAAPNGSEMTEDGKPIIDMHGEDAQMLEGVLRECYPNMESTAQKDLGTLVKVLVMATKFEMEGLTKKMEILLQQDTFLKANPLRVYAIACRFGLRPAAEAAAKECLLHPSLPDSCLDDYEGMSALDLYKLLAYRKRCIYVLDDILLNNNVWPRIVEKPAQNPAWRLCTSRALCSISSSDPSCLDMLKLYRNVYQGSSSWFVGHIERTRAAFAQVVTGSTVASLEQIGRTCTAIRRQGLACYCADHGPSHLLLFTTELAAQVDRALAEIEFDPAPTASKRTSSRHMRLP